MFKSIKYIAQNAILKFNSKKLKCQIIFFYFCWCCVCELFKITQIRQTNLTHLYCFQAAPFLVFYSWWFFFVSKELKENIIKVNILNIYRENLWGKFIV